VAVAVEMVLLVTEALVAVVLVVTGLALLEKPLAAIRQ
jgi:hypothetical protein